ncbi:hypothetical protein, partial [Thermococcus sp. ES12]|uniref:hypothetical protein n=1 Tax=Thermococcus sp. ES12 TaxID=1638246 RepID=UPI00197DDD90
EGQNGYAYVACGPVQGPVLLIHEGVIKTVSGVISDEIERYEKKLQKIRRRITELRKEEARLLRIIKQYADQHTALGVRVA